jgi:membrane protein required for colicin V production
MNNLPISVVDIGALIILLLGAIIGLKRGLSGEIARFVGTIIAFCLGIFFYKPFGMWLVEHTRLGEKPAHVIAFVLMVAAVLLVTLLVRLILRSIMKISFEGNIERIGGLLAGFIRATVLVLIIFVVMNMWPHEYLTRIFGEESVIGRMVVRYMPAIEKQIDKIPVKEKVEDIKETVTEEMK